MVLSILWFALCMAGLDEIPKCRYGEVDCYFARNVAGITDVRCADPDNCIWTGDNGGIPNPYDNAVKIYNKAVEGDNNSSYEQLAIPLLVTLMSLLPPLLVFLGTIFQGEAYYRTVEVGKFFLIGISTCMLLSCRIVDNLTFDCRWWVNDNQDTCKNAFGMFISGAFFTVLTQIALLTVAVFDEEKERSADYDGLLAASSGGPPRGGVQNVEMGGLGQENKETA